ncbi:MAG: hypothetical protein WCA35_26335 [Kovacikia sp.]
MGTRNRHIDPVAIKQKAQSSEYRLTAAGIHRKDHHGGFLAFKLINSFNPSAIAQAQAPAITPAQAKLQHSQIGEPPLSLVCSLLPDRSPSYAWRSPFLRLLLTGDCLHKQAKAWLLRMLGRRSDSGRLPTCLILISAIAIIVFL